MSACVREWWSFLAFVHKHRGSFKNTPDRPALGFVVLCRAEAIEFAGSYEASVFEKKSGIDFLKKISVADALATMK